MITQFNRAIGELATKTVAKINWEEWIWLDPWKLKPPWWHSQDLWGFTTATQTPSGTRISVIKKLPQALRIVDPGYIQTLGGTPIPRDR